MSENLKITLPVLNRLGLHARAAAKIAALAQQYQADIILEKDGVKADARSILDILCLGCSQGSEVHLRAQGPEAFQAVEALSDLFHHYFGEPQCRP
ncbi:HPr family phosphocarrier protein [Desulfobacca acetoxidans]|uniref:Phosphotransferase system, phosphocarrier protein HPr n=1 Tax=Desulfobacca acetoxidans (strain ATCC 700848 / DSM 11109 / ASRB2) TaxID=880072 RepID=F2NF75_DESAR|nr:HPr family phosphocarrier protein [Desulfobacca acetoxidans]AEB08630.1 Phosphotransferase system, phosphocarrier protein HPr [Desulfobacca acetoxidans DSM 11109]HAY22386.1 HPr family phosphocarrier protein [Desulfobacterales bacterium]